MRKKQAGFAEFKFFYKILQHAINITSTFEFIMHTMSWHLCILGTIHGLYICRFQWHMSRQIQDLCRYISDIWFWIYGFGVTIPMSQDSTLT